MEAARSFDGWWQVRRRIMDARSGQVMLFTGQACLSPAGFEESGVLRCSDSAAGEGAPQSAAEMEARRSYHLAVEAGALVVRFPDGRLFFRLGEAPRQHVEHLCGADFYRGAFVFGRSGWSETWQVRGPRKDYRSISRFTRLPGHAAGR